MKADEAAVPHVNRRCTYQLCGMADEVGRHARQVVGQIVEEIRHHSLLLGQGGGTCLNVPFLYPVLYPLLYPPFLSDKMAFGDNWRRVSSCFGRGECCGSAGVGSNPMAMIGIATGTLLTTTRSVILIVRTVRSSGNGRGILGCGERSSSQ